MKKLAEAELGVRYLAQFEKHKLLKFLSLNKKFNQNLIKAFYYNLNVTTNGLDCHFRNKLIKFTLKYFDTHYRLWEKRDEVGISNDLDFVEFDFVKSISKSVFGVRFDMENFHINQVRFKMRVLHYIFVKMLYMKPLSWDKADEKTFISCGSL